MLKSAKTIFIIQLILAISIVLGITGFLDYKSSKADLYDKLNVAIDNVEHRLSLSLPASIWNFNLDAAKMSIASELRSSDLRAVKVLNPQGQVVLFVSLDPTDPNKLIDIPNKEDPFSQDLMATTELVYSEYGTENKVGSAIVYYHTHNVEAQLESSLRYNIYQVIILDLVMVFILIFSLSTTLLRPLKELTYRISQLASGDGDLSHVIPAARYLEFQQITDSINQFTRSLREIVADVSSSSVQLKDSAESTEQMALEGARQIDSQQNSLSRVAAAATQMNQSIATVADTATIAATQATDAAHLIQLVIKTIDESSTEIFNMRSEMNNVNAEMHKLLEEGRKISTVVNVINEISEQTNLLALNAAIEAARAGDHGRGFAVVAEEVRNLSQKTSESTEQIQSNIRALSGATESVEKEINRISTLLEKTATQVSESQQSVIQVTDSISEIAQQNSQISQATEEQRLTIEDVSRAIVEASEATHELASGAKETASRTKDVLQLSSAIRSHMQKFKI